ncbi:MAG: hydroxyisourate hydrolase [Cellvibrionaceae bacterium]|nr:hydroxyisourate hydrolase [Cellvibrionaceae bacterium]|tara:strand:- start:7169 stop:7507 length:339 start_codon:yes stop_codon:yes gene_type:complete
MSQITTHVLDTARGLPAKGIHITLGQQVDEQWITLGSGTTNEDGRLPNLCPEITLPAGTYRMHFETAAYLKIHNGEVFYPYADVTFRIGDDGQHYHIPLLLSPYGYSTYRGS